MTKSKSAIGRLFNTYVVDALSFMAMGLFCSLILGLIIKQIALIPGLCFLMDIAAVLQSAPVVGGSIGLAIALGLKRAPLVTISAVAVGALGYQFGGPVGAYLASIVGVEAGSLVSKRTPVDIILTPLVAVVAGGLFAKYCCAPINEWVMSLGEVINRATMLFASQSVSGDLRQVLLQPAAALRWSVLRSSAIKTTESEVLFHKVWVLPCFRLETLPVSR